MSDSTWPDHAEDCASLQPWAGGMRAMGADECDCPLSEWLDDLEREEAVKEKANRRYSQLYEKERER